MVLRDLPEPVITFSTFESMMNICVQFEVKTWKIIENRCFSSAHTLLFYLSHPPTIFTATIWHTLPDTITLYPAPSLSLTLPISIIVTTTATIFQLLSLPHFITLLYHTQSLSLPLSLPQMKEILEEQWVADILSAISLMPLEHRETLKHLLR